MTPYSQRGFSLIETMIVLVVLMVVLGAIFSLMTSATQRSSTEQVRLDTFQEAREFMDQMSRDLRQAGYPSPRNVALNVLSASPVSNDSRAAVGLVKVATDELWFEGDVDGTGIVSVVHYWLDPSTTDNCPCLRRSQLTKITANPFTGQTTPAYQSEVQNVQNTAIFSAFKKGATGSALTLPINFNANGTIIAGIDTVQAVLTVEGSFRDPQTKVKPLSTLAITVNLNNCSQAANGAPMSCN
jgi:prepilin-type N-terminal cleavage/methylation domain-containing protein